MTAQFEKLFGTSLRGGGDLTAIFGPGGFDPARHGHDGDTVPPSERETPRPPPASSPRVPPVPALAALVADCEDQAESDYHALRVVSLSELLAVPPAPLDPVVTGCFESGDKVELVGPSKCRKSFFAIDLALHLAAGRDFLGLGIPRPRRVLLVNLEIKEDWLKRRFSARLSGAGIDVAEVGERLHVLNARGRGEQVREQVLQMSSDARAEVVIIDPRYKLMRPDENENAGEGVAGVLRMMDDIAESGRACFMVSHDAKGAAGDRDDRDRGAGSGWAGRDVDCRFVLTPHADDADGMAVLSIMRRNYPPGPDSTIRFEAERMTLDGDTPPVKQTTSTRRERTRKTEANPDLRKVVVEVLKKEGKPVAVAALLSKIQRAAGMGVRKSEVLLNECENDGLVIRSTRQPFFGGCKLIGLPEQMEEFRNPKLPIATVASVTSMKQLEAT